MNFPAELKYSKSHEWLKEEDGVSVIGISDFAQDALGDVVFVKWATTLPPAKPSATWNPSRPSPT